MPDDLGRELPIARGHRVPHRLERTAVAREPAARLAVQGGELVRKPMSQLGAEHLGEQRVVAEPPAARVERVDEALGSLELAERVLPAEDPASASASSPFSRSTIDVRRRKRSVSSS